MTIKLLDEVIINQIAAGEVVERPASVVKELVENSLDSGASNIEIVTSGGGKTLIRVTDNGCGISKEELALALSRHCTSKLTDNINAISALGFRGEALPSIASVSKLSLTSRPKGDGPAYQISVMGGKMGPLRPAAGNLGTTIEVCDLFYATPARLKFLKSERAESAAITDIVKRLALAFPEVQFTLSGTDRPTLKFPLTSGDTAGHLSRIAQVMGKDFAQNSVPVFFERDTIRITGFAGLPCFNKGTSLFQFSYVNQRNIRDKIVLNAIKAAYSDRIAKDRHGAVVLFITIDPAEVDVNVHPAKAEVRFRDPGRLRSLVIAAIGEALWSAGIRPVSTNSQALRQAFRTTGFATTSSFGDAPSLAPLVYQSEGGPQPKSVPLAPGFSSPRERKGYPTLHEVGTQGLLPQTDVPSCYAAGISAQNFASSQEQPYPLGAACGQIHKNYILAQTAESLILVDQHAAHERIIYEKLKRALYEAPLPSQLLLLPEIISLPLEQCDALLEHTQILKKFGFALEGFGPGTVIVREVPALLGQVDVRAMTSNLAEEAFAHGQTDGLKKMLDYVAATMACHSSIRAGRLLKTEEMNALLRQMEMLPSASTCNHGRPTYIELKLTDIERLFGRRS